MIEEAGSEQMGQNNVDRTSTSHYSLFATLYSLARRA